MLGILAALGTVLSLVLFLRSRDDCNRIYWLGYALLSAFVLALWAFFGP